MGGAETEETVLEQGTTKPEPGCEEIRLALAMNGGVSLAVWMGGCAVELDRARRAESSPSAEGVYDVLTHCFGRRLVIDVLTGTSAGGINAALLGATMAHGRELPVQFVRERWIELGDLGAILHRPSEESPTALMDGKLFHQKLLEAFGSILDEQEPSEQARKHARVPDLDITMTDLLGVERRFRDSWGGELVAREHRPRFRFRQREHFTKSALADAARVTASFPFAFEPWRVADKSRVLAGLPGQTWGIDGGLLDNAPIRSALDLIPGRRASAAVRRYFCYVNGDPTASREEVFGAMPDLAKIGGYAVNLPRAAPLVDHLYAIQGAVERPLRSAPAQQRLLSLELEHLQQVAGSLFDTYADQRGLESLEEILLEPGDAKAVFEQLKQTDGHLPWIPRRWQPGREPEWEWGMRPAQRILHLALDLLRAAIAATNSDKDGRKERRELLRTRVAIDTRLAELGDALANVTGAEATNDPSRFEAEGAAARVNAACKQAKARAGAARSALDAGLAALLTCMDDHPGLFPDGTRRRLFGNSLDPNEGIDCFLRRALSIEVVRRAFAPQADIESAEELDFVQLTPESPSPIFSSNPIHVPGPVSAEQKLTGVGLGHFAGFYRRSWRANDYMWGRLDAAARIVDLLLDSPPPDFGVEAQNEDPEARSKARAKVLCDYLNEKAKNDEWLLREVLAAGGADLEEGSFKEVLETTLARELRAAEQASAAERVGDEGAEAGPKLVMTRALFQRVAQADILREELPVLLAESRKDRELGSGAKPLRLPSSEGKESLRPAVRAIRKIYRKGSSLPDELTGEGEEVSDLGLQTITHASFVGLAAIRTAGLPMSKYLGFARPPLLAVAGAVASKRWVRATAALGFSAAALFLASLLLTIDEKPDLDFSSAWSPESLVTLIALLAVAAFVLVPGLRVRNGVSPVKNSIFALSLLVFGVGAAVALAVIGEGHSVKDLLFTPGAEKPPEEVLWGVLVLLGVVSFTRFPLPKRLQKLRPLLQKLSTGGKVVCSLMALSFLVLSAFTIQTVVSVAYESLWEQEGDLRLWRGVTALCALLAAPIAAAFAVSLLRRRRREKG